MSRKVRLLLRDDTGQAMIIFALILSLFCGFAALVIDVGAAYVKKAKLQNAVDAACLAAVQELPNSTEEAENVAKTYIVANGFTEDNIESISFTESNKKISMTVTGNIKYFFASILNRLTDGKVNAKAAAAVRVENPFDDFDYAIFSGDFIDILHLTGSKTTVVGNIHSNHDLQGAADVTGAVTVAGEFKDDKITATGGKYDNSEIIAMPDFSTSIKEQAIDAGAFYTTDQEFSAEQLNWALEKAGVIYVEGSVKINGNGVNSSAGCIVATGNIEFKGSDVNFNSASTPICLYSTNGNITLNGGKADIHGIVYAPQGSVTFNGQGGKVYGRLIGNKVKIDGAIHIESGTSELSSVSSTTRSYSLVE